MTRTNYVDKISLKKEKSDFPKTKIVSSKAAEEFSRNFYHDDLGIYESFFLILLNRANNTIGWVKIGQGGVSSTTVDVKIIAKYAIESLCSSVILVHNHPSGNTLPSQADKSLTKQIKEGLQIFHIQVLDHLILTEETYLSMSDEGLM